MPWLVRDGGGEGSEPGGGLRRMEPTCRSWYRQTGPDAARSVQQLQGWGVSLLG